MKRNCDMERTLFLSLSLSLPTPPSPPATLKEERDGERGPRVLRGLSAHRRAACFSTWIFRSGEGCVNPSPFSSSFPSLPRHVSLYPTLSLLSPYPPPFPRTCRAVGYGAAHRRRYAPGCRGRLQPARWSSVVFGSVRPSVRRASSPSQSSVALIEAACVRTCTSCCSVQFSYLVTVDDDLRLRSRFTSFSRSRPNVLTSR